MLEHDVDLGQVQVMKFPWHLLRKWWDRRRIWSDFRPNCPQKDIRKFLSHFYREFVIWKGSWWRSMGSSPTHVWCTYIIH